MSLTHVNEAFNQLLQSVLLVTTIQGSKSIFQEVIYAGTNYAERVIVENRCSKQTVYQIETEWLGHHGSLVAFGADPEFCSKELNHCLQTDSIQLQHRSSRLSHKNRRAEKNKGIFNDKIFCNWKWELLLSQRNFGHMSFVHDNHIPWKCYIEQFPVHTWVFALKFEHVTQSRIGRSDGRSHKYSRCTCHK